MNDKWLFDYETPKSGLDGFRAKLAGAQQNHRQEVKVMTITASCLSLLLLVSAVFHPFAKNEFVESVPFLKAQKAGSLKEGTIMTDTAVSAPIFTQTPGVKFYWLFPK